MSSTIFIILNLLFLTILVLFLARQGNGASLLEQSYAKEIALAIDSAKPGMTIKIDMEKAKKLSDKDNINFNDILFIKGNIVTVKLTPDSGYSYSFFRNLNVTYYPDTTNPKQITSYIFKINEYKNG